MGTIKKAVIPVAGFGTRFLPATKAMPKEMLPVIDKPLAQYVVEEARAAGIEQIIFVTGRGKAAIENHFDHSYELTDSLRKKNKHEMADMIEEIELPAGSFAYVRQKAPAGLGDAISCARAFVGDEDFAVLLPDILIDCAPYPRNCLRQLIDCYDAHQGLVLAVDAVPAQDVSKYGVIDPSGTVAADRSVALKGMVEKPSAEAAPSNLAITGRYILPNRIFDELAVQSAGAGGEVQLTDAMARLIGEIPAHAVEFEGMPFDCGSKRGFFDATLHYAKRHPALAGSYSALLNKHLAES